MNHQTNFYEKIILFFKTITFISTIIFAILVFWKSQMLYIGLLVLSMSLNVLAQASDLLVIKEDKAKATSSYIIGGIVFITSIFILFVK